MFMMYFTCRRKRGRGGMGAKDEKRKRRTGFPFLPPSIKRCSESLSCGSAVVPFEFSNCSHLSSWRNNESFKWSHRRISSALTQKRQPFATLKNFLTWTKFKIYFVKLFAVIIALKYFSLFSNLLSFFGLTRVGCFCYKSKSYLHSSFLPKFFPSLQLTWFLRLVF